MKYVKESIGEIDTLIARTLETVSSLKKLKASLQAFDSRDTSMFEDSFMRDDIMGIAGSMHNARHRIGNQRKHIANMTRTIRECTSEVDRIMGLNDVVWNVDIEGVSYMRTIVENSHCVSLSFVIDPEHHFDIPEFIAEAEHYIAEKMPRLHWNLPGGNLEEAPLHFQEDSLIVLISGEL